MSWGHIARIGDTRNEYNGRKTRREHSEDLGIDGKTVLNWVWWK